MRALLLLLTATLCHTAPRLDRRLMKPSLATTALPDITTAPMTTAPQPTPETVPPFTTVPALQSTIDPVYPITASSMDHCEMLRDGAYWTLVCHDVPSATAPLLDLVAFAADECTVIRGVRECRAPVDVEQIYAGR